MARIGLTRGQEALEQFASKFSEESKALKAKGLLGYTEGIYFIRKEIVAGTGMVEILKSLDDVLTGVCNFSKLQLPNNANLALERIEIRVALDTTATTASAATYVPIIDSMQSGITNAEFEVLVDDKSLVKTLVNRFQERREGLIDSPKDGLNLNAIKIITEKNKVKLNITYPEGTPFTVAAGKKSFIEIALRGDATKLI